MRRSSLHSGGRAGTAGLLGRSLDSPVRAGLAGKLVETLVQALLVTLLPRLLGPAAYGQFALALALVTIGSASVSFSGPTVMARFVPAAAPERRPAVARALALRIARWRLVQVMVIAVLPGAVVALADPDSLPATVVALVVLAFALDVAATLVFQVALGLARPLLWSFRYPIQYGVLVAAAPLLFELAGSQGAIAALAVASGAALAVGIATALPPVVRAPRDAGVPAGALRFGALQGMSGPFSLIVARGGVVAVALLAGSSVQTGYAALAIGVTVAATQLVVQIFAVELPGLVAGIEESGGADRVVVARRVGEAERRAERLTWRCEFVVVPLAVVAAVLAEPVLGLAVGDDFRAAADAFVPALATLPLVPITALALQSSALRLRPGARLAATAAGALAFAITALLAVPAWDAAGGSAALLAGTLVTNAVSLALLPDALRGRTFVLSLAGTGVVLALGLSL